MKRIAAFIAVVLCLTTFGILPLEAAPPPQEVQDKCSIVSPATGSQVRGQVAVTGSATHPDYRWHQVGYAPDPNPSGGFTFFASSETSVNNGQLAIWDTTLIPDGVYQLILEVHRKDGNNHHCFVRQIRVNNTEPTPTYTAVPLPTRADTPTPLPTQEDTPTVDIEQPPTATSRPTPTYSAVDNPTPTPEMTRFKLPIETATLRSWSCRGAQVTLLVFLIVALYFIIRNVAASSVRKVMKDRNVDGFYRKRPRGH